MKQDIDSILLANYYFIKCKVENPSCHKTELARKYLVAKISKALSDRQSKLDVLKDKAFDVNRLN
jgi:hypothetical protein